MITNLGFADGTIITGAQLKATGKKFFLLISEKYDGLYKTGINVDKRPFRSSSLCIYPAESVFDYASWCRYVREITISDDQEIYVSKFRFKANKLILGEKMPLYNIDTLKILLDAGADIHTEDDLILFNAVDEEEIEIVKYLLDRGADINAIQSNTSETVLSRAASNNNVSMLEFLLSAGADIHAHDDIALRYAAYDGAFEAIQFLIQKGANVTAHNSGALTNAAMHGHLKVVKLLVQNGAEISADNYAPLYWALKRKQHNVFSYLVCKAKSI